MSTQENTSMIERAPDLGGDKEALKKEFSVRLHQALRAKDWRQADLVRASGMPKDSVSQYYRGRILPTDHSLGKIAKALGVDPDWLVPGSFTPAPVPESDVFEILNVPSAPHLKRVRMDKTVPSAVAAKIFTLVQPDDADGK